MTKDGLRRRNFWVYNLDADNSISGTSINGTTINGTTINGTTISGTTLQSNNHTNYGTTTNSHYNGSGTIINTLKADTVISGGMWVIGSAASGTAFAPIAISTVAAQPLGICLSTVASGANVEILTTGVYTGIIAEASLNNGVGFSIGAGTAANCAKAAGAGTTRGTVLMGGGSEATISVYLW